jgi:hypothetical protein
MKAKSAVLSVVLLSCGFVFVRQSSAQRNAFVVHGNSAHTTNSNCKLLKGTEIDLFDPVTNISKGVITESGYLDGVTLWSFPPQVPGGFIFTPDPNVVSYLSDLTITTNNGVVKTRTINTQNISTPGYAAWGYIDGAASTGRFAGASGLIFFSSFVPPPDFYLGPYTNTITGQVCFAK